MRILQLIDTLHPGGAERMAVNYANSLAESGIESFLVTTRSEGVFVSKLNKTVKYYFLNKKNTLDYKAVKSFIQILRIYKIDIVHAHGTSWFFASLCKMKFEHFKLIWHNHSGNSLKMPFFKKRILISFSRYFNGVINVNQDLLNWSKNNLLGGKHIFLPNFILSAYKKNPNKSEIFRIVCISNLRPEKNHILLIKAAAQISRFFPLEVHFIGKSFNDDYSRHFLKEIENRDFLFFHESVSNIEEILSNMNLGVLVSSYEGMPMAILEYGSAKIPVISTNVGSCPEILDGRGTIIPKDGLSELVDAISEYKMDLNRTKMDSDNLHDYILSNFSSVSIIPKYLIFCKSIC